jgi:hypothetical protein
VPTWEDAIGACVAGWLTDEELAQLRGHTHICAGCGIELAELSAVANWLLAHAPPPNASEAGFDTG